MNYILRRRGLGGVSCSAIALLMTNACDSYVAGRRVPSDEIDYVFRWGYTGQLPLEAKHVVNTAEAISLAANKKRSRLKMQEEGVFVPETWNASELGIFFPTPGSSVIVRPERHSQGNDLYHCTNLFQIQRAQEQIRGRNYISRYIPKVREYRVYVVCGRVIAVADKHPDDPSAIAWNHAQGSSYRNVRWDNWPLKGCYEAIKATASVGLDFAGIDVMEDAAGNVYVLEANSAPSLLSDYRTACMAKAFDYIVEHGKAVIPLGDTANWRSFIHPAIRRQS